MEVENKRLEMEKAAWEAEVARREAEKALKAKISAAEKKAKDAADAAAAEKAAKLKEEHEKAIEAAKKKTDEAEAAKKKLEEDAKKNAPDPDSGKAPILFKDALGRKFTIPYGVGKSWRVSWMMRSPTNRALTDWPGYARDNSSSVSSHEP